MGLNLTLSSNPNHSLTGLSASIERITAHDLACVRGGRLVFRDLNFELAAGRLLVLEGPNGSGKTSSLRVLAGFIPPVAGVVALRIAGGDIVVGEERAKHVGWIGHQDAAKSQLTPKEALEFFTSLYAGRMGAREALAQVGLSRVAELPCQYLSAGQKKRLALARLCGCGRPIWLLDEPFASLDDDGRQLVVRLISEHCARGGVAIAATHEPIPLDGGRLRLG